MFLKRYEWFFTQNSHKRSCLARCHRGHFKMRLSPQGKRFHPLCVCVYTQSWIHWYENVVQKVNSHRCWLTCKAATVGSGFSKLNYTLPRLHTHTHTHTHCRWFGQIHSNVWTWMTDVWVPSSLCACVCVCVCVCVWTTESLKAKPVELLGFGTPASALWILCSFLWRKYVCCSSHFSPLTPLTPALLIGQRSSDQLQIGYWDMTLLDGRDPK